MRIIAKYRPWEYRYWAFLPTFLEIKELNVRGEVEFLLDTGAGETILSEKDALRLEMPYKNFPMGRPAKGIGGSANTYSIDKKVDLYIPMVGGGVFHAFRNSIEVLEEPGEEKKLPSLLGLEFLEQLEFKLIFDMPTKSIFLER